MADPPGDAGFAYRGDELLAVGGQLHRPLAGAGGGQAFPPISAGRPVIFSTMTDVGPGRRYLPAMPP
jgi:hypothetical protein